MEYHQNQFTDFSFLIFNEKKQLIGLFPANITQNQVHSHQGLSYGGLIVEANTRTSTFIEMFNALMNHFHTMNIKEVYVKNIPNFYCTQSADEIDYLAYIHNAHLYRRDFCSVINLQSNFAISTTIERKVKKAITNGITIEESTDFQSFWNQLLIPNLHQKYGVAPVHSIDEIQYLKDKFPNNIRLFIAKQNTSMLAGTVIFQTPQVAHAQYISGIASLNHLNGLELLFHHLIKNVFAQTKYFDFGISNEQNGRVINQGLLFWKESFGARSTTQSFYKFNLPQRI